MRSTRSPQSPLSPVDGTARLFRAPEPSHNGRRAALVAGLAALVASPGAIALAATTSDSEAAGPALDAPALRTSVTGDGAVAQDLHRASHRIAVHRVLSAQRRAFKLRGDRLPHHYPAKLRDWSVAHLLEKRGEVKRTIRSLRREARAAAGGGSAAAAGGAAGAPSGTLQAIAACESGGNPSAIGGGGAFRGKYQFTYSTWAAVGGSGDPAAAPESEQDMRAAMLYSRAGAGQWPVCGR